MDVSALTGLLPLGGASVLLIYLLQIWLTERKSWQRERAMLYDLWMRERQDLTAAYRKEIADRDSDYQAHIESLRARLISMSDDMGTGSAGKAYHDQSDLVPERPADHLIGERWEGDPP